MPDIITRLTFEESYLHFYHYLQACNSSKVHFKPNMACVTEYSTEQLIYHRICYITTDVLPDGLRIVFKQEWDNHYKSAKGRWKDEPKNGLDFYNGESPRNQRRNSRLWPP